MPRATLRTPEVEQEILSRMAKGEPLAWICRDEHLPHMSTWREWCRGDDSLDIAHMHARDDGYDCIAADTLAIADDTRNDTKLVPVGDGEETRETANTEWISRSKLRVETRLKLLAKWDPRRYGEATKILHADADGGKLPALQIAFVTTPSDEG